MENTQFSVTVEKDEQGFENSLSLAKAIYKVLDHKNGEDLAVMRVGDKIDLTDYFVLCTAQSNTHVKALTDEVEYQLSQVGVEPHHIEGKATGWILLDYDTVIVHVFTHEAREFYSLDKQWQDGKIIDVTEFLDNQGE